MVIQIHSLPSQTQLKEINQGQNIAILKLEKIWQTVQV